MELLLNELSIAPIASDKIEANSRMSSFCSAVAEARKCGFGLIRSCAFPHEIELCEGYFMSDWLNSKAVPEIHRNLLYGMITTPFIRDDDTAVVDGFIESEFFFEDTTNGIAKTNCFGLASAYLYESMSVSLDSSPAWRKTRLEVSIETQGSHKLAEVWNVYQKSSYNDDDLKSYLESLGKVDLQKTALTADKKSISLFGDHHGKKELKAICDRIKHCPYVIEMRSTNFGGSRCIRKCKANGELEFVLIDSQRKYALWIKTTGRNLRETKAIGEILENDFG